MPADSPRTARLRAPLAALAAAALAAAVGAQGVDPPVRVAETGRRYATLQEAVDAIGAGTGTVRLPPGVFHQCAVQRGGTVTFQADEAGRAILSGVACEGKAALVLRGAAAQVDGLVFERIAVEDRNGAGIRLENGPLTVTASVFRDSEQGIMSVNGKAFALTVDRSLFARLGTCEGAGGCAHAIYMGDYGALTVTRSRFSEGRGGHYVKSRAARTLLAGSIIDDSGGRDTNYLVDLPNGGRGAIEGNTFVQGSAKDNASTLVAVAAEGAERPSTGLAITGNTVRLASGVRRTPAFVTDWSGDPLLIGGNRLPAGMAALVTK